jgi:hypothetical protein
MFSDLKFMLRKSPHENQKIILFLARHLALIALIHGKRLD